MSTAAAPLTASPARASREAAAWFCALVGVLAIAEGIWVLWEWVRAGTAPGARALTDALPLSLLASLVALGAVACARRAPVERWALAALAWAFGVSVIEELPLVARSHEFCDGPWLRWVYLGLALAAGAWALCTRIESTRLVGVALLVFWSAANARLWGRDSERIWVLAWAALLVVLVAPGPRAHWRDLLARLGRPTAAALALMLAWFALAAAASDSPATSVTAWLRVLWGALFAFAIASGGREALRMSFAGALAAAFAMAIVLAVGLAESLQFNVLERVLHSRLRLLGMHSNGIGPFIAACLCIALARLLAWWSDSRRGLLVPAACSLVVAASAFALWRCESRASTFGAAAGVAALGACAWGRLPRRTWTVGLVALGLLALGLVLLATPLADGLHAKLAALTQTKSSLGQRYHLWSLAARVLELHPWFGAGPNVYYLHAQFAPPTFYDFTPQVLHSHSLYVGIAEGSGWIGLAAFLVVCIGTADLLRLGCARGAAPNDARIELAGIAAALAAVLASNLLDVGQGRNTFVPLLSWTALGSALALLVPTSAGAREHTAGRTVLAAAAALAAFAILPALSLHAATAARERAADGAFEDALRLADRSLALWPLEPEVRQIRASTFRATGRGELALEELRVLAGTRPGYAGYQLTLSRAELELGDPTRAKAAALQALRLDPRGQDAGEASFALAGACFALGERAEGEAAMLQGLRTEGSGWRALPQTRTPARAATDATGSRIAFLVGDRSAPSARVEFDELLGRLEQEMRDAVAQRPVEARRLAGRLVDAWRAIGRPERALAVIDEFTTAAKFTNSSFDVRRLEVLAELGRADDAERARAASGWRDDAHMIAAWARSQLTAGGAERVARVMRDVGKLEASATRDISFDAGQMGAPLALAAQLALQRDDPARALEVLASARYDCAGAGPRLALSQPFLALCAQLRVGRELGLAALREVLFDASLDRVLARDAAAMRNRARWLRDACGAAQPTEAEIEAACAGLGAAGAAFLRAWREPVGAPADG